MLIAALLLAQAGCGRGGPGSAEPSDGAATARGHEAAVPAPRALGVSHVQSGSGLNSGMGSGLGLTGTFPSGTSTHSLGAGAAMDLGGSR